MNPFGKSPQEQAMQKLIHDTNSGLGELLFHIKGLSEWLKQHNQEQCLPNKIPISSTPYVHIEYLKSKRDVLIKAIDTYVEEFKNDFKKENS